MTMFVLEVLILCHFFPNNVYYTRIDCQLRSVLVLERKTILSHNYLPPPIFSNSGAKDQKVTLLLSTLNFRKKNSCDAQIFQCC